MQFGPLSQADLRRVAAINAAYLQFIAGDDRHAERHRRLLSAAARQRVLALDASGREVVAACPFLLCSVRDLSIGADAPGRRTLQLIGGTGSGADLVVFMALTMLSRIARRRPFAARVLSGTDIAWCRELEALDEPAIAGIARAQAARLKPVHADVPEFWSELLRSGRVSRLRRRAVRAAGLQLLQSSLGCGDSALAARRLRVTKSRSGG